MNRQKAAVIRSTRAVTQPIVRVWHRWRTRRDVPMVQLDSVRRRLELLISAMYGRTIRIEDADSPVQRSWIGRLHNSAPRHLRSDRALSESDAECIRLPREIADHRDLGSAADQYRLLAIEHAERIMRGTAAQLPDVLTDVAGDESRLERDLYLICEAAVVDSAIVRSAGGVLPTLMNARADALAHRPELDTLAPPEREVELLVRRMLAADPTHVHPDLADVTSPADSLAWARATATTLRGNVSGSREQYRGIAPVALWGTVLRTAPSIASATSDPAAAPASQSPAESSRHWSGPRSVISSPMSDSLQAQIVDPHGPPSGSSEATGADNAADSVDSDGAEDVGSLSDRPSEEIGGPAEGLNELSAADVGRSSSAREGDTALVYPSVEYPEWDCNAGQYRPRCVAVRVSPAVEADPAWAADILAQNAVLVRRVRQQFERLRSQRVRLPRQRDGDELDLAACVRALVDRRMGHAADDRLYVTVQPARRSLAIALLVDISGSTNAPVNATHQVIDIEKMALLLASEALDALGDRYAMLTFSSMGAADVRVTAVKSFSERNGEIVRRRISAIAPAGNTRLGAAIRHATALLSDQPAGHRLLLVLSDGKPSDTDRYFEQYAVEDSRQAVFEARAQDVYPFCLTVDAEEPGEYLSHIFGPAGHTTLRRPEQLPLALLKVVRQLLGDR